MEKLISLRKKLFSSDMNFPAEREEAGEYDDILLEIIGSSREKHDRIAEIINLALLEEITARTASVAIQELVTGGKNSLKKGSKASNISATDTDSQHSEKKKSREQAPKTSAEDLEALKERGWNT